MPSVPAPGEFTVCEINRDLLTRKDDVDKTAQDAYVGILGRIFSSIPFRVNPAENDFRNGHGSDSCCDDQARDGIEDRSRYYDSSVPTSEREGDVVVEGGLRGFLAKQLSTANKYITSIYDAAVAPRPEPQTTFSSDRFQAVNWHQHKHWLAFISSADQVLVYNFEDRDTRDPAVLTCDSQRFVEAVEWRPNSGATLAIASSGGIFIWSATFPGNVATVRPGVVSIMGTTMRGTGTRWSLVDCLKSTDNKPVTSVSWSPNGRLLATASRYGSAIIIWDAALGTFYELGVSTKPNVRAPNQVLNVFAKSLAYSPAKLRLSIAVLVAVWNRDRYSSKARFCWNLHAEMVTDWGLSVVCQSVNDYPTLHPRNGEFDLWETNLWTSEPWSGAGGNIVSAMWGPDGHVLLMAFDETTNLGTIYFPSRPPSLDVHLLPLELPEIGAIIGGKGNVEKMAWDGTGERLAVSYIGGDAAYNGLIAIFDTRHSPIVSTTFLGFIRGPGFGAKPLAFAFHNELKQGALLAVSWSSGVCCSYPFLFRAHK